LGFEFQASASEFRVSGFGFGTWARWAGGWRGAAAPERGRYTFKRFKGFRLKAKARIRPGLSCMCHICTWARWGGGWRSGAKRVHLQTFRGLSPESRGRNPALTALHVPYLLEALAALHSSTPGHQREVVGRSEVLPPSVVVINPTGVPRP